MKCCVYEQYFNGVDISMFFEPFFEHQLICCMEIDMKVLLSIKPEFVEKFFQVRNCLNI